MKTTYARSLFLLSCRRWGLCSIGVLVVSTMMSCATTPKEESEAIVNDNYVMALSVADRFAEAWCRRPSGISALGLLTPRLKATRSEDDWKFAFSGLSNPHHEAYEIGDGRRLADDRYAFHIRFYEYYTGSRDLTPSPRPDSTEIVVVESEPYVWRIDEINGYL